MAAHSNRSPSPLSSRPINPNPRNPENNSTIRRSFTGNNTFTKPSLLTHQRRLDPNTPANSPSDFARRRSVGKDCEEKENDEKDCVLKASKLQSPAKGCKNFMAPTISAASKFTPSPRKKVLVERNDPVRTSISFSDGKAMFFSANVSQDSEPKSELGHQKNQIFSDSNLADSENNKAAVDSHPVSRPCKKVTFSDIPSDSQYSTESVITDSADLKLESKVVSSPIAPLDADPSLPPYDPKTNYLSPRPQFIRYKPNPRVGMLLNKDKALDSDELEFSLLMSEGFSNSDEGSGECQTEMEVTVSADMVIGLDEEIEADAHVSEPQSESLPVSTTSIDEITEEEFVQPRRSLSRLMCFSMILILLVACASVSVTRAPSSFDEFSIKDLSSNLYEQSRVAVASARVSFGSVARHVNHVSANAVSLIFKLANELVEGEKQVPLQFMNLSDLQESSWKEAYFLKRVENIEEDEFEEELDSEMDDAFEEEAHADEEVLDTETDVFEEEEAYAEADNIDKGYYDPQDDDVLATQESAQLESDYSQDIQMKDPNPNHQHQEVEAEKSQGDINHGSCDNADTIPSDQNVAMAESTQAEESLMVVAIPCLFAGLVGVAAFMYYHYKRNPNVVQVLSKQTDTTTKQPEMEYSESEMSSSYQRSGANEVERKYSKRESLASSTESPSYGSFTTYERIPIKSNGHGEEEIITPVRRSSRIRKQVTSPAVE